MSRNPLRRSRLAAAAALSLAGGLLGAGAFTPAHAECAQVSVWTNKSQQAGRDYVVERQCVVPTPWNNGRHGTHEKGTNVLPPGTPGGAGVEYSIP
jgi:hypothetical protein